MTPRENSRTTQQDARLLWQRILERLKKEIPPQAFRTWLNKTQGFHLEGNTLLVLVPHPFYLEWLQNHYHDIIQKAARAEHPRLKVRFDTEERVVAPPSPSEEPTHQLVLGTERRRNGLLVGARFENFVVGPGNQLAFTAAQAVARKPFGGQYNPLVLYGQPGVGKSHLLHALGNAILQRYPEARVLYVTTETFLHQMFKALDHHRMEDFKRRYRSLDVLLLDDLHFLQNKNMRMLQEELVYTFNALDLAGKRIVVASQKPPQKIRGLDRALLSRLRAGLVVEIHPPDLETRKRFLLQLAREKGLDLSAQLATYIAEHVQGTFADLEGVINKLQAMVTLVHTPLNQSTVQEILSEWAQAAELPSPARVLQTVAQVFRVRQRDLTGKTRRAPVVRARHAAAYLLHEFLELPFKEIGSLLGGRDHSTVIHGYRTALSLLETDDTFRNRVEKCRRDLGLL